MFGQVVGLLADAFGNLISWFMIILESSDMYSYYLVAIFFLLLARFLLYPLFGAAIRSGASDTVRRMKNRNKE